MISGSNISFLLFKMFFVFVGNNKGLRNTFLFFHLQDVVFYLFGLISQSLDFYIKMFIHS